MKKLAALFALLLLGPIVAVAGTAFPSAVDSDEALRGRDRCQSVRTHPPRATDRRMAKQQHPPPLVVPVQTNATTANPNLLAYKKTIRRRPPCARPSSAPCLRTQLWKAWSAGSSG